MSFGETVFPLEQDLTKKEMSTNRSDHSEIIVRDDQAIGCR
jgi:hypothetical protein